MNSKEEQKQFQKVLTEVFKMYITDTINDIGIRYNKNTNSNEYLIECFRWFSEKFNNEFMISVKDIKEKFGPIEFIYDTNSAEILNTPGCSYPIQKTLSIIVPEKTYKKMLIYATLHGLV